MEDLVRVLGFGDNVVDKYEHIRTMYPGGNCVNFAVYAKMLKADRSAYMGYFGNDAEAEHVIRCLNEIGVETVKCRQLSGENGCARVSIEGGERIFKGSNQGGIRGRTKYVLDRFDLEYIRGFDLVHSGNYSFMEGELGKIKREKVPVSFDFSEVFDEAYSRELCKEITYAFLSCSGEEDGAVKEKLESMKRWGASKAVATRGSSAAIGFDGEAFYRQNPVKLDQMADTMGAGDSFITAFLVEEVRQRKAGKNDMQEALRKAAVFAASVCRMEGAFGYGKSYT